MSQNAWRILRARGTNNVPLRRRGASSFSDLLAAHIQWLKTRTKEAVLEHERLLKDGCDELSVAALGKAVAFETSANTLENLIAANVDISDPGTVG